MQLPGTCRINDAGHLEVGGCDTVTLASKYGTPLYVVDEEAVRFTCRQYRDTFRQLYPDSVVAYAGKAFLTKAMVALIEQEGLHLDVVSGGELWTALEAGYPPEKIFFHGNNKSEAELHLAVRANVGRVVVDSEYELEQLDRISKAEGKRTPVFLRLTPGVEAKTHSYIQTGQMDSKFGFNITGGKALAAVKKALSLPGLSLVGIHCHIGSQIFELNSFARAARLMIEFMATVKAETGVELTELDLGGGLGVPEPGARSPIREYARVLTGTVRTETERHKLSKPKLIVEPGRSIVGPFGLTLYTIGATKAIPGIREYIAVDGGMSDNPRPALYRARYHALVANRAASEPVKEVTVAGKCCESGDILIRDLKVAEIRPGDILAVLATGAYNFSMSSNYNRLPRPAVVAAYKGTSEILVKRETYEDVVARDRVPARFQTSLLEERSG